MDGAATGSRSGVLALAAAVAAVAVAFVIALTMRERPLQGREPSAPVEAA